MAFELHICGTRGSFPALGNNYDIYGQETTCLVVKDKNYALVIDGGTGLINALPVIKDCTKIDFFLTHLHHDHIMGLMMIPNPFPKVNPVFYGNFSVWKALMQRAGSDISFPYPDIFIKNKCIDVIPGDELVLNDSFHLSFRQANHGDGALMVTIEKDGKRICFTGDNEYVLDENIITWAQDCDYLIFDGCYSPEKYPLCKGWGHSSWISGCELAKISNVKNLIITHHDSEATDSSLSVQETRAKGIFANTVFAKKGMCCLI